MAIVGALTKHLWVKIRGVMSKEKLNIADCSELHWEGPHGIFHGGLRSW